MRGRACGIRIRRVLLADRGRCALGAGWADAAALEWAPAARWAVVLTAGKTRECLGTDANSAWRGRGAPNYASPFLLLSAKLSRLHHAELKCRRPGPMLRPQPK